MEFPKDILVIDFEATGNDFDIAEPIQLAGLLLDRVTLEEKKSFDSLIRADISKIQQEALPYINVDLELVKTAPLCSEVIRAFIDTFGTNVFISSFVSGQDMRLLHRMLQSLKLSSYTFDYHILDLWPLAYIYLLKKGYTGSIRARDLIDALGIKKEGYHNALNDCKIGVEILRKIVFDK